MRKRGWRRRRGARDENIVNATYTRTTGRPRYRSAARGAPSHVFLAATHPEGPQVGGGVVRSLLAEGTAEHVTRAMAETAGASPLVTHV